LRSVGIECGYRDTEEIDLSLEEFTEAGPREILVHPSKPEVQHVLIGAVRPFVERFLPKPGTRIRLNVGIVPFGITPRLRGAI
jgi:hypothetical protein